MLKFPLEKTELEISKLIFNTYQHAALNTNGCPEQKLDSKSEYFVSVYFNPNIYGASMEIEVNKAINAVSNGSNNEQDIWWANVPLKLNWNEFAKEIAKINADCKIGDSNLVFVIYSLSHAKKGGSNSTGISPIHKPITPTNTLSNVTAQVLGCASSSFQNWTEANPSFPKELEIHTFCNSNNPDINKLNSSGVLLNYMQIFAKQFRCETIKNGNGQQEHGFINGIKTADNNGSFSTIPGVCQSNSNEKPVPPVKKVEKSAAKAPAKAKPAAPQVPAPAPAKAPQAPAALAAAKAPAKPAAPQVPAPAPAKAPQAPAALAAAKAPAPAKAPVPAKAKPAAPQVSQQQKKENKKAPAKAPAAPQVPAARQVSQQQKKENKKPAKAPAPDPTGIMETSVGGRPNYISQPTRKKKKKNKKKTRKGKK